MENLFVAYDSAFEYWQQTMARETRECHPATIRSLASSTASAAAVRLGRELSPILSRLSSPLHVMVDTQAKRLRSHDVMAHSCNASLPPRSFCTLDADGYLASPELTLAQHANTVSFPHLLLDMHAWCGTYAIDADDTRGFANREAITSAQRLAAFARNAPHLQGSRTLRRALPYLANGSASPRETVLSLLLCLPRTQGGYGLPTPLLNTKVAVPPKLRPRVEKDWYMPDLYWPAHRVAMEYNSTAFHTGARNIANDSKRTKDFAVLGIELITVTAQEIQSQELSDRVARRAAVLMGKRLRPRNCAQIQACRKLRAALLSRQS